MVEETLLPSRGGSWISKRLMHVDLGVLWMHPILDVFSYSCIITILTCTVFRATAEGTFLDILNI